MEFKRSDRACCVGLVDRLSGGCGTALLLAAALALAAAGAAAQNCAALPDLLDDAREAMRQVSQRQIDLAAAQEAVRQARVELGNAATAALACRCGHAAIELQRAADQARQAENATAPKQFQSGFNNAVLAYNTALDLLRDCH
jgi:hypothetical protein